MYCNVEFYLIIYKPDKRLRYKKDFNKKKVDSAFNSTLRISRSVISQ